MPAFITARVVAYLVAALGLTGGFLYYRHTLILDGEQKIEARVAAATAAAEAKRTKDLAAQRVADNRMNATIEAAYVQAIDDANAKSASLTQRLHDYEVASRRSAAVPGTPATPASPDVPAGVADRIEAARDRVNGTAARDADKVIALQSYITKECH